MIAWLKFKKQILSSMLKDPNSDNHKSEDMLTWARWALAEASMHTASSATFTIECDGFTNVFDVPDDSVDPIDQTAILEYNSGNERIFLPFIRPQPESIWPLLSQTQGNSPSSAYSRSTSAGGSSIPYEIGVMNWPENKITLQFTPGNGTSILMHYFRIWDEPVDDDSVLKIPRWMEQPVAYMIAAYSMDPDSLQSSEIRQWNGKTDSGTPEQNTLQKQAKFFMENARRIFLSVPPQDRATFFGAGPQSEGYMR